MQSVNGTDTIAIIPNTNRLHQLELEAAALCLTLPSATSASRAYTSSVAASACMLTRRNGRQKQKPNDQTASQSESSGTTHA
jgi:hypothetical protein